MSTRFSSLAAVVITLASFALVGCAGEAGEPDTDDGASTAAPSEAEGTLHARGFTYNTAPRYHFCNGDGKRAFTTNPEDAQDGVGFQYEFSSTRWIPGGACHAL
ncbi:MAG: hypothetical protein R3B36_15010 [Polyangiaceae bacterium]